MSLKTAKSKPAPKHADMHEGNKKPAMAKAKTGTKLAKKAHVAKKGISSF